MRVALLNDNAIVPHVGCLAVSDAHARMLARAGHEVVERFFAWELAGLAEPDEDRGVERILRDEGVRSRLDAADAVVVNGEGTIHHGAGLDLLAALGAGQRLGKRTLLVNAVLEQVPGYARVLARLDDLTVRDGRSARAMAARGVRARVVHDSVLEASFHDEPAADLSGRIAVLDWHPARNADVGRALASFMRERRGECFYFPLFHGAQRFMWRHAVATLRTSRLVVTARHHGVYLAALAGRSFVALPSNTHKIEGLIGDSGLPIPVCTDAGGLADAVAWAGANPGVYAEFAAWLLRDRPLSAFAGLGVGNGPHDEVAAVERIDRDRARYGFSLFPQARLWPFGLIPELADADR